MSKSPITVQAILEQVSKMLEIRQFLESELVMVCLAGSHLYGTVVEGSDIDLRGVFIPPKEYLIGCFKNVEQLEDSTNDITIFALQKFCKLCSDGNPNIVELLFIPGKDTLKSSRIWGIIAGNRENFLSTKVRHTFTGYAHSQLKRIEGHRNWLLHPPKEEPTRVAFGLPAEQKLLTQESFNAFKEMEDSGNVQLDSLDGVFQVFQKEKAYQKAKREWQQYQNWKTGRNPARAALEVKKGFDTKHGGHLYRLLTEGKELLLTGHITFPRPDCELLLDIRNGKYDYYDLMGMIGDIDLEFAVLERESILPKKPNINKIDDMYQAIILEYLKA